MTILDRHPLIFPALAAGVKIRPSKFSRYGLRAALRDEHTNELLCLPKIPCFCRVEFPKVLSPRRIWVEEAVYLGAKI